MQTQATIHDGEPKGQPSDVVVRVFGANGPAIEYKIDRWD